MKSSQTTTGHKIYKTSFASVYPYYVAKAEKKRRTKAEVDECIRWLTGYSQTELKAQIKKQVSFEDFFHLAPKLNPDRHLIKGKICGVDIEQIKEPLMKEIRYLDKLIDDLAKGKMANPNIDSYNKQLSEPERKVVEVLRQEIDAGLPEAEKKIWYAHPVWFLEGNPVVGYSKIKDGVRLMFWSGADFNESGLKSGTGKFKDASIKYVSSDQIDLKDLKRWLAKSKTIQWDYKNIVKRKGVLRRIK